MYTETVSAVLWHSIVQSHPRPTLLPGTNDRPQHGLAVSVAVSKRSLSGFEWRYSAPQQRKPWRGERSGPSAYWVWYGKTPSAGVLVRINAFGKDWNLAFSRRTIWYGETSAVIGSGTEKHLQRDVLVAKQLSAGTSLAQRNSQASSSCWNKETALRS